MRPAIGARFVLARRRTRRRRSDRRGRPGGTTRDHGQEQRDRDGDLDREEQRARAGEHEDPQDLLGRVGRRADRVRAEDRERLALGQPLADLLLGRQRAPEDDGADPGEQARRRASAARSRRAWRSAGRGPCSGSTERAAAPPGRVGPPLSGPSAADGLRSPGLRSALTRWAGRSVAASIRDVGDDRVIATDQLGLQSLRGLVIQQPVPPVAGDVLGQDDDRDRGPPCRAARPGRGCRGRRRSAR